MRVTIAPPTLDTREIGDAFRQTGRFVFDDQRFREAFPKGLTNFTPGFTTNLDVLGKFLQDNPHACQKLVVEGHTDIRGTVSFNQRLSEERARTVANYLQQNFQISIPVETIGRGRSQLITTGTTETDHAQNRRITVSGCEPPR
ncbi:MAG: OmpA family protein [Alphaproteobacteria bacterium]|nr:OmpA family protein [Alphaproteobacteria bacterium]